MFSGSATDWERVATANGVKVRVIPGWKGDGTVLLVWSTPDDMPLKREEMVEVRALVDSFCPVNVVCRSVSVG